MALRITNFQRQEKQKYMPGFFVDLIDSLFPTACSLFTELLETPWPLEMEIDTDVSQINYEDDNSQKCK